MSEKEYNPDDVTEALSPDQPGFFNEATLSATKENERLKAELAKEKALRMQVQADFHDDRTELQISEEFIEGEVEKIQDFYNSPEGEAALAHDVVNFWENEAAKEAGDSERDIRETHSRSYYKRRGLEERLLREKIEGTEKK